MNFASDNWAGASDRVAAALQEASAPYLPAYGGDPLTAAVERALAEVFEHPVQVFFVATGSAANALSLAHVSRPGGVVFCHAGAHIRVDEAGGPEFLGGCRLHPIGGPAGKLAPGPLAEAVALYPEAAVHHGRPVAVSISQLTEAGTAYSATEIGALCEVAHAHAMPVHMDGARFANAMLGSGMSAAEMSWRAGIDMISFGATKNGCFAAEAVLFFDKEMARGFAFQRKRAGHLFSKSRFVAAQFGAYLADGHWLELAGHANAMAQRLAKGIEAAAEARLALAPDGNEVFAYLGGDADRRLREAGAGYYEWPAEALGVAAPAEGEVLVRLVTHFRSEAAEVDRFLALLSR